MQEVQQLQLINEDELIQETDGLGAVTMRDPNTNTLYVWSVFPNSQTKWSIDTMTSALVIFLRELNRLLIVGSVIPSLILKIIFA